MDKQQLHRMILLGDAGAGKTSIILKLVQGNFYPNRPCTTGIDFYFLPLQFGDPKIKFQVFDTGGHDRFDTITENYLRGADGALLVYDLNAADSYAKAVQWFNKLIEKGYDYPKVLVGNKKDQIESPDIKQAQEFANEKQISFIQTSAKTGYNIKEPFLALGKAILDRQKVQHSNSPITTPIKFFVHDEQKEKKESNCCKNTT